MSGFFIDLDSFDGVLRLKVDRLIAERSGSIRGGLMIEHESFLNERQRFANPVFQTVYRFLIMPSRKIEKVHHHHKARLLSSFLLFIVFIFISFHIIAFTSTPNYQFDPADLVGYAFLIIAYFMSRTKWYQVGAWLMIAPIPVLSILSIISGPDQGSLSTIIYLVIALLLASIFFNLQGTIILASISTLLILLIPIVAENAYADYAMIISPLFAYLIAAMLVVVFLIHRNRLERDRQKELKNAYDITLEGWAKALELRDKETLGHSKRVTNLTLQLARKLSISEAELEHIRRGALLHDVGKMAISDIILNKVEQLTAEDWEEIRQHPKIAYQMLRSINYLRLSLDIPLYHHEKWDGSGYPYGLAGNDIPFAARIFAVADVWDALTSKRPYRDAWPKEKVIAYMLDQAGNHFDPAIIEVFMPLVED